VTQRKEASLGQDADHQGQDMRQGSREASRDQGADTDITRNTENTTETDQGAKMTGEEAHQDVVKRLLRSHLADRLQKREEP
jgi:hypothetical protein